MVSIVGIDQKNKRLPLDFSNEIVEVDHRIQTLEFEFVGLSFTKSEKNNYKYTLENYIDTWIEKGHSNKLFSSFAIGNFVQAYNTEDALNALMNQKVVLLVGGIGNVFFLD